MKLDKIKFAKVVYFIATRLNVTYINDEFIADLDNIIDVDVSQPPVIYPASSDISQLMFLMQQGTQKIEAIKQYRMMTGMGLKESKDAVERYWPSPKVDISERMLNKIDKQLSNEKSDTERDYILKNLSDTQLMCVKEFIRSFA